MQAEREIREQLIKVQAQKKMLEISSWMRDSTLEDLEGQKLSEENIDLRINHLASELIQKHPQGNIVLICLLEGAIPFANKLNLALAAKNYTFEWPDLNLESTRQDLSSGLLAGRVVILIEDIYESNTTYAKAKKLVMSWKAKEVNLMVLVNKVHDRQREHQPDISGFQISKDSLVIGSGLDFVVVRKSTTPLTPSKEEQKLLNIEMLLNSQLRSKIANHSFFYRNKDVKFHDLQPPVSHLAKL
ncbi:MAG: hypothetical protein H0U57_03360 [Tatlockia sp.]|nr:hypothetical protein [Tatlockia sp.]